MKVAIDAVNEFKGVWPADYVNSVLNDNDEVATKDEFMKCVDELSEAEWMTEPACTQSTAQTLNYIAIGEK